VAEIDIFGWKIDSERLSPNVPFRTQQLSIQGELIGVDQKLVATIQIGNFWLVLRTRLPFKYSNIEVFRLSDQLDPQALRLLADPLLVQLGGLRLILPAQISAVEPAGSPNIGLTGVLFPEFSQYPIRITPEGALSLDLSDPADPRLTFAPSAFTLDAHAISANKIRLFNRTYYSEHLISDIFMWRRIGRGVRKNSFSPPWASPG
jgi:hypothetical protein